MKQYTLRLDKTRQRPTMFEGLIYQIDTVNHVLNIEIPDWESNIRNLRVVNEDGKVFVLCGASEV